MIILRALRQSTFCTIGIQIVSALDSSAKVADLIGRMALAGIHI